MNVTTKIPLDYHVEWDNFDEVYRLLDDPDGGVALIEDPLVDAVPRLLEKIEEYGELHPELYKVHFEYRRTYEGAAEAIGHREDEYPYALKECELMIAIKKALDTAIQPSVKLRKEIASRLISTCDDMFTPALQDCAESEGIIPTHFIPGAGVQSRIDYHTGHETNHEPLSGVAFNTRPHFDQALFTEHGGCTHRCLKILLPETDTLMQYDIPAGTRLLFRGDDWHQIKSRHHLPILHSAESIDWSNPRTRWLLLWRLDDSQIPKTPEKTLRKKLSNEHYRNSLALQIK